MKISRIALGIIIVLNTFPITAMNTQAVTQKAQEAKAWIAKNKGKIIAMGFAIAAILGTGYLAAKAQPRLKVIEIYEKYNIKTLYADDAAARDAQTTINNLGLLTYEKGLEGLKQAVRVPNYYLLFKGMLLQYPNLDAALAELAGPNVSAADIRGL